MMIGASHIGGAQKVFLSLANEFIKDNRKVVVLLPQGAMVKYFKSVHIDVYVVNFMSVRGLIQIYRIIKAQKPDIINTHLTNCSFIITTLNLLIGTPICCTLHNEIIHAKLNVFKKLIFPLAYNTLSRITDGIIVVSKYAKRNLMEVAHAHENKIRVVYNGIEMHPVDNIRIRSKKIIFASVGRLSIEKGQIYLIEAANSLKTLDFECWLIGDGPTRAQLETKVQLYGINEKVKFLGFRDDITRLLHQIDILVIPSLNENLGMAIVEAFSQKIPVIASNVGGISELIANHVSGLLIRPKDSKELANAMSKLYFNPEMGNSMGVNGYKAIVNKFTTESMSRKTLSFYQSIIQS